MARDPEQEKLMMKALASATPGPRALRRRVAKKAVKAARKYGGENVQGTMQPVDRTQASRQVRRAR